MIYEYKIRKKAIKFIRRQDKAQQKRLLTAIYALPFSGDIKKLQGESCLYRIRVGDYRILFEMTEKTFEVKLIDVTDAGNRGQIYK